MFNMSKMLGIAMAISFFGCAQPFTSTAVGETGIVQFGPVGADIEQSQSMARGLASTGAASVVFSVTTTAGVPIETDRKLALLNFNGNLLSQNLVLPVGSYRLTSFQLHDADDNVIYVTPLSGSAMAYLVANPLPLTFNVAKNVTSKISPEVITTANGTPGDFGYYGIDFTVVPTFDSLIQVQSPLTEGFGNVTANLSITVGGVSFFTGDLVAGVNQIKLKEVAGNYVVTVSKLNYTSVSATFTLAQMKAFLTVPNLVAIYPTIAITRFVSDAAGGGGSINLRYLFANSTTQDVSFSLFQGTPQEISLDRNDVVRVESLGGGGGGTSTVHRIYLTMESGSIVEIYNFPGSMVPPTGTVLWNKP